MRLLSVLLSLLTLSGFTKNSKYTDEFRKKRMHGLSVKTGEKQGAHILHQLCGVAITLFGFTDNTTSKYTD